MNATTRKVKEGKNPFPDYIWGRELNTPETALLSKKLAMCVLFGDVFQLETRNICEFPTTASIIPWSWRSD